MSTHIEHYAGDTRSAGPATAAPTERKKKRPFPHTRTILLIVTVLASAGNALIMPLFAPLGDFAGVDRALIVTTFNAIGGWIFSVLPTNAVLMARLGLAAVGFNSYLRFMMPLMGIWLVIQLAVFVAAAL